MPKARAARTFVIAPFQVESKRRIIGTQASYEEVKRVARQATRIKPGKVGFAEFLQASGVAEKRRYGLVLNIEKIISLSTAPRVGQLFRTLLQYYSSANPAFTRVAQLESLAVIKQLRGLGFRVKIQDSGERKRAVFVRAAQKAGAIRIKAPHGIRSFKLLPGTVWARDQWVKIGGKKEKPKTDIASLLFTEGHFLGEGGSMVQVGPREFAIAESIVRDPRLANYERAGYKFQVMPYGAFFDRALTDYFGTRIYTIAKHLDLLIGGIPEKRVAAIDLHYYNEHRESIEQMQRRFGTKIIVVPETEADRHPQNFLPLGQGKVLVDSGAPSLAHMLKNAGLEAIPTAVPLNALLYNRGGLHCLFNEY